MAKLSLRHLYKVYPNGVKAVNDFSMEIDDKEFIVFVGPSGCGKSTTLRMIAGLEEITAGELFIGDNLVNHTEPKDRDIAMVFQNYALYPHMTVYENLAFGLQLRHVPQAEIHQKVLWAANILKLSDLLERKPKALSGGQRQRVSLGRAILRTPKVFLLDEPLSNLDAKLRTEMRAEIAKLHQKLATTFIYVTHDQVEAMTMGTKIVVMNLGYIQQIDTPKNLYDYPDNKFVAGFIGTPQMNFFHAVLKREGNIVKIKLDGADKELEMPFAKLLKVRHKYLEGNTKVVLGLRCENLSVDPTFLASTENHLKVRISHFEELGNETLIYGDLDMNGDGLSDSDTRVIVKQYGGTHESRIGDIIDVAFDLDKAHFFDMNTEKTIAPRIPGENAFDCDIKDGIANFLGFNVKLPPAIHAENNPDALLVIPTDALFVGGNDIRAEVISNEFIKNTHIVHLGACGRAFFMLADRDYSIGEMLELGIDMKRISIEDSNQKTIISAMREYDTFHGIYSDSNNMNRSAACFETYLKTQKAKEIKALESKMHRETARYTVQNSQLKLIKSEYAQKRSEILGEKSYRLGTESLGKEGRKQVETEAKVKTAQAKKEYDEKVSEFRKAKAAYDKLSESEKAERLNKQAEIKTEYAEKFAAVNNKYANLISSVRKSTANIRALLNEADSRKAREAEALIKKLKAEQIKALAEKEQAYNASIERAKADIATKTGAEKDKAALLYKEALRQKKDGMQNLRNEQTAAVDEIMFRSKNFAACINGLPMLTSLDVNKKIVKGLGARLFTSRYRFELPHDAYKVSESGIGTDMNMDMSMGIKAVVEETVDYGRDLYAKCLLYGESIFVKVDKPYEKGTELTLGMDISKARIYEDEFDIRLV